MLLLCSTPLSIPLPTSCHTFDFVLSGIELTGPDGVREVSKLAKDMKSLNIPLVPDAHGF